MTFEQWWAERCKDEFAVKDTTTRQACRAAWNAAIDAAQSRLQEQYRFMAARSVSALRAEPQDGGKDADSYKLNPGGQRA